MVERGDGFANFQVLGAEDGAAGDGDAVVDNHARVVGEVGESLGDSAAIQVVEDQAALHADQQDARVGGFGEESGTPGERVVDVFAGGKVQDVEAALRTVFGVLDGNPEERFADYERAFGR